MNQCSILGTGGPDTLMGGPTADLICGLGGDDRLAGGYGSDTLIGGPGDDRLEGGRGTRRVWGDCLLGGSGRNTFPGAIPDFIDIVQQGRRPGRVRVEDNGRCRKVVSFAGSDGGTSTVVRIVGGGGGGAQGAGSGAPGGGVSVPVTTGSLVLSIATLLEPDRQSTGFPVALVSSGRARDGVARLLLRCSASAVSGTLTLTIRQAGRSHRAGRSTFDCEPPTEVATVQLNRVARDRIARSGRLVLTARIRVDGVSESLTERLTIRSDDD